MSRADSKSLSSSVFAWGLGLGAIGGAAYLAWKLYSEDTLWTEIRKQYIKAGQGHVFKFWKQLTHEEKHKLIEECQEISLETVAQLYEVYKRAPNTAKSDVKEQELPVIEAFDGNMTDFTKLGMDFEMKRDYDSGMDLISQGKVAALLMAGGQGTRLGSSDPKGMFDIGLLSRKSLFQLQAERLIRLRKLAGLNSSTKTLPWYIMTSPATHQKTVDFFERNNYFTFPKADVFFFQQGVVPCLTTDGKIIMESKCTISKSPNGNGGIYEALQTSGALADMKTRGVQFVFTYSVDNALVQVCDPQFIGYCHYANVDFGNKVVAKRSPDEKVGVLAKKNGKNSVVEYSEMTKEMTEETLPDGKLKYGAGNIAIHCFTIEFLEKVIERSIPYHIALKKIDYVSDDGSKTVKATEINGVKFEKFIFDSLEYAEKPGALMVVREGNFSPVKNATGPDSPETARRDLSNYHIKLIKKAGGDVDGDADALCEISPLVSYNGERLEQLVKGVSRHLPLHIDT